MVVWHVIVLPKLDGAGDVYSHSNYTKVYKKATRSISLHCTDEKAVCNIKHKSDSEVVFRLIYSNDLKQILFDDNT